MVDFLFKIRMIYLNGCQMTRCDGISTSLDGSQVLQLGWWRWLSLISCRMLQAHLFAHQLIMARTVAYYGCGGEEYIEEYPAIELK